MHTIVSSSYVTCDIREVTLSEDLQVYYPHIPNPSQLMRLWKLPTKKGGPKERHQMLIKVIDLDLFPLLYYYLILVRIFLVYTRDICPNSPLSYSHSNLLILFSSSSSSLAYHACKCKLQGRLEP